MAWCRIGDKPLSKAMLTRLRLVFLNNVNSKGSLLVILIKFLIPVWICNFIYYKSTRTFNGATARYNDVIMGAIASQINSLTIVYSTVYSGADQRKHQSSASLAFVWWIHQGPVNSPHKWPVTRKMFPFDDVIMEVWEGIGNFIPQFTGYVFIYTYWYLS